MPLIILAIFISYLVGSLPTAYCMGRILKNIDIRKFGSGNVGATNALRVLGKKAGIAVLLIDMLKGFLVVILIGDYVLSKGVSLPQELLRIILGLSCILGHNWTLFLNFKGGKGVATTFGVLTGLSFRIPGLGNVLALSIQTWLITFILFRIVSVSSVLSALTLPIFMLVFHQSKNLIVFSLLLAIFIILRHLSNLKRVFQGKEPRLK